MATPISPLLLTLTLLSLSLTLSKRSIRGPFCRTNEDCIDTTFCCSTYQCTDPSNCLQGQKLHSDTCDYNFECLSRCCADKRCAHFLECYETCDTNSHCKMTNCCSEDYCTHDIVCKGNKITGDYCDTNSECISNHCFHNECQLKSTLFPVWIWLILLLLCCIALLMALYGYFCLRHKHGTVNPDFLSALDHYDKRTPLLNKTRKFMYNNQSMINRKKPPMEVRFHATPILEEQEGYNTYD